LKCWFAMWSCSTLSLTSNLQSFTLKQSEKSISVKRKWNIECFTPTTDPPKKLQLKILLQFRQFKLFSFWFLGQFLIEQTVRTNKIKIPTYLPNLYQSIGSRLETFDILLLALTWWYFIVGLNMMIFYCWP